MILKVKELIERRDAYCDARKYPRELMHPAANWELHSLVQETFRRVFTGDPEVLKNIKRYAQPFSAFDAEGTEIIDEEGVNPNALRQVSSAQRWVSRYEQIAKQVPSEYRVTMPNILGERGTPSKSGPGSVINHDAFAFQERVNLLYESGVLGWLQASQEPPTILEVGGGFGGLAYCLQKCLNMRARYVIVDLPESLLYSTIYLRGALPQLEHSFDLRTRGQAMVYVPNYQLDEWLENNPAQVALAINTLSLVEMSMPQMKYYAERIRSAIGQGGMFFEQNHDGRWLGLNESKPLLSEFFPVRRRLKSRTVPVLTRGEPDLWANSSLDFLHQFRPSKRALPSRIQAVTQALGDSYWLQLWLRLTVHHVLPPWAFVLLKRTWNRLGFKMKQ